MRRCVLQVSQEALKKRHAQDWLHEMESDLENIIQRIRAAKSTKQVHRCLDLHKSYIGLLFWNLVAFGAVQ
jgi:urocanate hydratase